VVVANPYVLAKLFLLLFVYVVVSLREVCLDQHCFCYSLMMSVIF